MTDNIAAVNLEPANSAGNDAATSESDATVATATAAATDAPAGEQAVDRDTSSDANGGSAGKDNVLIDALKEVIDPELMINVVDLGLVYEVEQQDDGKVMVDMTLTSPACPAGPQIIQQAKMALERLDEVPEAEIRLVMSPPWTPERMTDDARDHLGIF